MFQTKELVEQTNESFYNVEDSVPSQARMNNIGMYYFSSSIFKMNLNSWCEHSHHCFFRSWICDWDSTQHYQEDAEQLLMLALRSPDQGAKGWHHNHPDDAEPRQVDSAQACLPCKFLTASLFPLQLTALQFHKCVCLKINLDISFPSKLNVELTIIK